VGFEGDLMSILPSVILERVMLGIYWSRDSCDSNNIAVRLQLSTAFESNVLDQRNDQREKGGVRKGEESIQRKE